MAINFNYQNPTAPLAIGGAIDAHRTAYNSGKAGYLENTLARQQANQAAGAQMFAQQMYGLANTAIAQEYQTQRDARLFTQSMQMAKANTDNAMNLYRDKAAVEAGFYGDASVSPWQQAQQVADEKYGGDISKMLDMREIESAERRVPVIARLEAQAKLAAKEAEFEQQQRLGTRAELDAVATPQQKASIAKIKSNIEALQSGQYAHRLNPFESQRQLFQAKQDLERAYSSIEAAQPTSLQQEVQSGTSPNIWYPKSGGVFTKNPKTGEIRFQDTRPTNIATPMESINRAIAAAENDQQYADALQYKANLQDQQVADMMRRQNIPPGTMVEVKQDDAGNITSVAPAKTDKGLEFTEALIKFHGERVKAWSTLGEYTGKPAPSVTASAEMLRQIMRESAESTTPPPPAQPAPESSKPATLSIDAIRAKVKAGQPITAEEKAFLKQKAGTN